MKEQGVGWFPENHFQQNEEHDESKIDREDDRPADYDPGGGSGRGDDLGRTELCQSTSNGERTGVGVGDVAGGDGAVSGENVASRPVTQADPDALAKLPQVAENLATEPSEKMPQVVEKPLPKNVLPFTTGGKSSRKVKRAKSTSKRATGGKSSRLPKVEDVKASKGTWAFRLRWNSLPGRPVVYVRRVTDAVHKLIREENYEAFKEQLISSYSESALRASGNAG